MAALPVIIDAPFQSELLQDVIIATNLQHSMTPGAVHLTTATTATATQVQAAIKYNRTVSDWFKSGNATIGDVEAAEKYSLLITISHLRDQVAGILANALPLAIDSNLLEQLTYKVSELSARVDALQANTIPRLHNAWCSDVNGPVYPLHREAAPIASHKFAIGSLPPAGLFPATYQAANALTHQALDDLEAFYETHFETAGSPVAARVTQFRIFIGCHKITGEPF